MCKNCNRNCSGCPHHQPSSHMLDNLYGLPEISPDIPDEAKVKTLIEALINGQVVIAASPVVSEMLVLLQVDNKMLLIDVKEGMFEERTIVSLPGEVFKDPGFSANFEVYTSKYEAPIAAFSEEFHEYVKDMTYAIQASAKELATQKNIDITKAVEEIISGKNDPLETDPE